MKPPSPHLQPSTHTLNLSDMHTNSDPSHTTLFLIQEEVRASLFEKALHLAQMDQTSLAFMLGQEATN